MTPAGVSVDVDARYFEPLILGDWQAPEECAYSTLVSLDIDDGGIVLESGPLNGPRHDQDRERAGLLGAAIEWRRDATGAVAEHLVTVVVFEHDGVATLSLGDAVDTQPTDGWTPLVVVVPAVDEPETVLVDLAVSYENGRDQRADCVGPARRSRG